MFVVSFFGKAALEIGRKEGGFQRLPDTYWSEGLVVQRFCEIAPSSQEPLVTRQLNFDFSPPK